MGGIETHLELLCNALRKSVDLRVLVANDGPRTATEMAGQVRISRLGTICALASAPICPRMASQIRASKADLVHVHLPNPMAVLAFLASGHSGPLVITYHSDIVRQKLLGKLFQPLLHAALKRSAGIIVTSPNYLETSHVLSEHRERCRVIPYGIRASDFDEVSSGTVERVRQEHGKRLIVSVGRLVYYKGFEFLIHAMTQISARLLIIGDGPLRNGLEQLAASLDIRNRVVFLREKQNLDLAPYYHAADVFVLPSVARSEAFGIVQLEAMACGKPVINTNLPTGVPFVSLDGVTGLTVPPGDPKALADAINALLDNPALAAAYGNAGRQRIQQYFTVESMAERTLELYNSILRSAQERATSAPRNLEAVGVHQKPELVDGAAHSADIDDSRRDGPRHSRVFR